MISFQELMALPEDVYDFDQEDRKDYLLDEIDIAAEEYATQELIFGDDQDTSLYNQIPKEHFTEYLLCDPEFLSELGISINELYELREFFIKRSGFYQSFGRDE